MAEQGEDARNCGAREEEELGFKADEALLIRGAKEETWPNRGHALGAHAARVK